jgi:choline kinase
MKTIILAAGVGKRLRSVIDNPKCLLKINGTSLLERYLKALATVNILDVVLVVGYKKEKIIKFADGLNFQGNIKFIKNPDFTKGSILSLYMARDELDGGILLMDGDVYFEPEILKRLINANQENLIAVDTTSSSSGEEMMVGVKDGRIIDMKRDLMGNYDMVGEAVGFYKFDKQACRELKQILEEQVKSGKHNLGYEDILPLLFQRVYFKPIIVDGLKWMEIDFEEDVIRAENMMIREIEK